MGNAETPMKKVLSAFDFPLSSLLHISMPDYKAQAAAKRASRDALIPSQYLLTKIPAKEVVDVRDAAAQLLTSKEIEITTADVSVLLEKLSKGEWTSQETLEAHIKRAVVAHQLVSVKRETKR